MMYYAKIAKNEMEKIRNYQTLPTHMPFNCIFHSISSSFSTFVCINNNEEKKQHFKHKKSFNLNSSSRFLSFISNCISFIIFFMYFFLLFGFLLHSAYIKVFRRFYSIMNKSTIFFFFSSKKCK